MQNVFYSKTVKRPLSKRPKIGLQDQLSLNAGQKYCRILQEEHSAIPLTFIKPPFVIKIFVLSIFEWPFYTGFTVCTTVTLLSNFNPFNLRSIPVKAILKKLFVCRPLTDSLKKLPTQNILWPFQRNNFSNSNFSENFRHFFLYF